MRALDAGSKLRRTTKASRKSAPTGDDPFSAEAISAQEPLSVERIRAKGVDDVTKLLSVEEARKIHREEAAKLKEEHSLNSEVAAWFENFRGRGIDDSDLQVSLRLSMWKDTHNPAYLWAVVGLCTKHGKALPPVVMDYLADVARRMSSPGARSAQDLTKVLPGILGFPAKKRGPGRLLDPSAAAGDLYDRKLAMLFAVELEQGRSLKDALVNATAADSVPGSYGNLAEPTLKRRIKKAAGLKTMPRGADEWRRELRASFMKTLMLLNIVSGNSR
jgi:hypothetical protein